MDPQKPKTKIKLEDAKTYREHHMKGGSECHFNGQVIPFGAMVETHAVSAKDTSRSNQFDPKVWPGIFFGHVFHAGWNLERGHYDRRH